MIFHCLQILRLVTRAEHINMGDMGRIDLQLPDFESFPAKYSWPSVNEKGYRIKEELYGTEHPLRVVAVGAGASGINLAKFLPDNVNNLTLKIFDKNPEVGGTWYENTYAAWYPF